MLVEMEFGLSGGRKTGKPGEKPSEQGENQQQTQPTCGTGPESNRDTSVAYQDLELTGEGGS